MASHFFGPLGSMTEVVVSSGVATEIARGSSEFVSAGGVRRVQRARFAPRSWTVGRVWQGPEWARLLTAAAHGLLGQCWLYDVAAARENMLAQHQTAGTGAAVLVGGIPLGSVASGQSAQVPVLAGRAYTASVWSAATAGATVARYRLDAGAWINITAPAGSGARSCSASFTPGSAALLTLEITTTGVSGLRVHDGEPDGQWFPGMGTPCKVAVEDPQRTLQTVTDQTRSDYQVTLKEVGKPGII